MTRNRLKTIRTLAIQLCKQLSNFEIKYRVYVSCSMFMAIFLLYVLLGFRYVGPTYLSDEVSYLTKAAFVAGFHVDNASSWHAGYSIVISPLLYYISGTVPFWRALVILNASMLLVSMLLLRSFLNGVFPEAGYRKVFMASILSALYPAWIVMSGYAFSAPLFILLFMLLLNALIKIDYDRASSVVLPAILSALVYWVHPLGASVCVATVAVLLFNYVRRKDLIMGLLLIALVASVIGVYVIGVHPWINNGMTPAGFDMADHYKVVTQSVPNASLRSLLFRMSTLIMGHATYLLVATFGTVVLASSYIIRRVSKSSILDSPSIALLVCLLSLVGVILMGSITFYLSSLTDKIGPDQLVYGRYSEMVLLPVLGVGILSPRNNRVLFGGFCSCALPD